MRGLARLQHKCSIKRIEDRPYVSLDPPIKTIPQEWVNDEVAILEAQANKLRNTVLRRRASKGEEHAAHIVDHYEKVLMDLEHQIAQLNSSIGKTTSSVDESGTLTNPPTISEEQN